MSSVDAVVGGFEIDLWNWSLDGPNDGEQSFDANLSEDELQRAARFVHPGDGARYRIGRQGLRSILSDYLDIAPNDLRFSYNEYGKPAVAASPDTGLEFNLSHSGDQAILAVSKHGVLGVDIEAIKPIDEDVAQHFFSTAEFAELTSFAMAEQMPAFYRCWTRKEAFVKAHGVGLSLALDRFDVSVSAEPPQILLRLDPAVGDREDWTIIDIAVADGHCGAVAARTRGRPVQLRYRGTWRRRPSIASIT